MATQKKRQLRAVGDMPPEPGGLKSPENIVLVGSA